MQIPEGTGGDSGGRGCLSRMFAGAFFSVFLGMGLLFTALLVRSLFQGQPKVLAFFVLLPLIFVAVGAAGLLAAIKGPKPKPTPGSGRTESLSAKAADPRKGAWLLVFFFSAFLAAGLAGSYALLAKPGMRLLDARSWRSVECTILSSAVGRHGGSEGGATYSVDITYEYEAGGILHRSTRYDFMGGSSSGYDAKADVVSRLPPGSRTTCFVNPANPADVVLDRRFKPVYLIGLFPPLFVAVGAAGMTWAVGKARGRSDSGGARRGSSPLTGPVELKAPASPATKLVGAMLVAAFWNGIVSVFVWQMVEGWRRGHPDGCLTVFMIPFVTVGLGLIGLVGYQFLALFNPRLHVTISEPTFPLGGSADMEWRFSGSTSRIERLTVSLEGREEATYRRGTSTSTDKHVFYRAELSALSAGPAIVQGRTRVTVPSGSVPTFASANNKIVWVIKIQAEIPRWPDVLEEFPLQVLPGGGAP